MQSPQLILTIGSFLALTICLQYFNKQTISDDVPKIISAQKDCKNGFCSLS